MARDPRLTSMPFRPGEDGPVGATAQPFRPTDAGGIPVMQPLAEKTWNNNARQQGRDYSVAPAFQSNGPMQPRKDVQSFDLTRNLSPGRALVTGDRSLTRNPSGRAGLPLSPGTEQIGSRGMTAERRSEIAGRRLSSAMRAGDMRATELLYRDPTGFGRGFNQPLGLRPMLPPPGFGMPPATPSTANNRQPPSPPPAPGPPPLDPLDNLPPPATMEEALGMPGFGPLPTTVNNSQPLSTPPSMPMPPPMPRMPWEGQPAPGGVPMRPALAPMPWEPQQVFDTSQPLPPSTLNGATGVPPPPRFSEIAVGGMNMIVDNETGKQVGNYKPEPVQPPPLDNEELRRIREGGFQPTGVFLPNGQPQLVPLPPAVPTERVTIGPDGRETRTFTQPRGAQAAPAGEGKGGNYFDSLLPAAPTASTQTGQMPNQAYAAPLSPEQMLEEARNEYARTGNDAALKQYFAQYPSEAVRLNQQEQQIWGQIGQEVDAFGRAADEKANAYEVRNDTMNAVGSNAFTAGAKALEYERRFPTRAKVMDAPMPMLDTWKFLQAKTLSDNAAIKRAIQMERIRHMSK